MSTQKTERIEKVKLGALMIDRRVWVRERLDLDHVRCLVNDLVSGKKFPPMKIDRQGRVVVGGNHRYAAYKQFYGNGWENQEVEVIFVDLPTYEKDPDAWHRAALMDNNHVVLKLGYGDRNKIATQFLKIHGRANFKGHEEVAELLHLPIPAWNEFSSIYLQSLDMGTVEKKGQGKENGTLNFLVPEQAQGQENENASEFQDKQNEQNNFPEKSGAKHSGNDIYPVDGKTIVSDAPRAQLLSKINALANYLEKFPVEAVDGKIRKELDRLHSFIGLILKDAV